MNHNFPGGDPVLIAQRRPHVAQRRARGLAPSLVPGSPVERGETFGDDAGGATAVTISLAERLHAAPKDVEALLSHPVGSRFRAGDEIAKARTRLRGQTVVAPFTGILKTYNQATGIALFMSSHQGEATAIVSGSIEHVDDDFVSIRTSGSRMFGIIGFGRGGSGPIRFVSPNPNHAIEPSEITSSLRGAVVVAGSWVNSAAYKRFVEVGVVAVISGGLDAAEIESAFNLPAGTRIGSWHDAGAGIKSPVAVIATEGFGQLPMHPALWSFLVGREGHEAIVTTRTEVGDRLARPQIIVEKPALSAVADRKVVRGSKLRVVDPSNLGLAVEAAGPPTKSRFENGRATETIDVTLPNRKTQTFPIGNIELIA